MTLLRPKKDINRCCRSQKNKGGIMRIFVVLRRACYGGKLTTEPIGAMRDYGEARELSRIYNKYTGENIKMSKDCDFEYVNNKSEFKYFVVREGMC